MSNKKCLVLMKYDDASSGSNESNRKYDLFIKPALLSVGFDKRDIVVIKDLKFSGDNPYETTFVAIADADFVIADISHESPTVFFELGVRLTLHKNMTLVISDGELEVASFVKFMMNIHTYKKDFTSWNPDDIYSEVTGLTTKINDVLNIAQDDKSSPIFKILPNLIEYKALCEQADPNFDSTEELESARKEIADLTYRVSQFERMVEVAGTPTVASMTTMSSLSFSALVLLPQDNLSLDLESLRSEMENSGEAITARLRETYIETLDSLDQEERLFEVIQQIDNNDNVDAIDYLNIAMWCRNFNMEPVARRVLEIGYSKFQNNIKLFFELMAHYFRSASPDKIRLAQKQLEQYFNVVKLEDGKRHFVESERDVRPVYSSENIAILFDLYIRLYDYKSLYETVDSAEQDLKLDSADLEYMFKRNKALAASKIGHNELAKKLYIELCDISMEISSLKQLREMLFDARDYILGYEIAELIAISCYDDVSELIAFAERIYNNDVVRTNNGIESVKGNDRIAIRTCIPILFHALKLFPPDETDEQKVVLLLYRMGRNAQAKEAIKLFKEVSNKQLLFDSLTQDDESKTRFSFRVLDYILQEAKKMEEEPGYIKRRLKEIFNESEAV